MYADDEFYTKCLKVFESDENFAQLDQSMQVKNYEDAFSAVHTLKGVAGNLSLTPLYQSLCMLTEKLRAHDYQGVDALYKDVKSKVYEFLSIMKESD